MIPLQIAAEAPDATLPFVVRVGTANSGEVTHLRPAAQVTRSGARGFELNTPAGPVLLKGISHAECVGDVLLVLPERRVAHRLIRAQSPHNTFLVTEQCDQCCVMCSQPPKKYHVDLFCYFEAAALLAPQGMVIGISGGEPTLHKEKLFSFLVSTLAKRPDLAFHVLTNAQHFTEDDRRILRTSTLRRAVTWGVPLYADTACLHDIIVGKKGAFDRLMHSLSTLGQSGVVIELRTVLLKQNARALASLATFISYRVPFVARWAIMQLEYIGFARKNWQDIFFDHSRDFAPVGVALDIGRARGIDVRLYNFPLCTIPREYRLLADRSISDWKRRYLQVCEGCTARANCTGFFSWYPKDSGFMNISAQ